MHRLLTSPAIPQYGSVILIVTISALMGRYVAQGPSLIQWIGGLAAIVGSILFATIVHAWPEPVRARVRT